MTTPFEEQDGISRSILETPPTHYTFKIQLFSLLAKNKVDRYESSSFEAGGYKWKLVLHPNGNENKNVKEHVSIYLAMAEGATSLPPGWEVYATFRMFLLDQNKDNYLTLEDSSGKGKRFHGMKLEWGFDRFIPLKVFGDATNGYLVDDCCVVGAEVFVCKERTKGKVECLTMIKDAITYKHSWKIEKYSDSDAVCYKEFYAGDQKWKMKLHRYGNGSGTGTHISLYLVLADPSSLPPASKIFAEFTLRILDQMNVKHHFGKGISRSISDTPPTHYTFKIQLFSLLANNNVDRYESSSFEAGGYKWKLVLHPHGNKNKNVKEHISIYLVMADEATSSLPPGWEVYATFCMFLLDQNKDNYLTLEDTSGKGKRFHGTKLEWGFDQFIPLKVFGDATNGYLVDDCCVFGAEVFVCKERTKGKAECLTMIKDAITYKHSWLIKKYSESDAVCYEEFYADDKKWKMKLYRYGNGSGAGTHISLYLVLADPSSLPPGSKIFAEFTLRMLDQINVKLHFSKASHWFSGSSAECGWARFISLSQFQGPRTGFLMEDSCFVQAEVTILGLANALI